MLTARMREYRKRLEMRQVELAQRVGCRRETIVNLGRGRYTPSLRLAVDVAKELHASVCELYFFTDD